MDKIRSFKSRGYSLIELMITMVIGMIIINGIIQVIFSSKRTQIDLQEISYIQENARFALDVLGRDIRMAGYIGCANKNTDQANVIANDVLGFIGTSGISGFEGDATSSAFPAVYRNQALRYSDSLLIRRGDAADEFLVRYQNPTTQEITLWENHNFSANQPLVIVDGACQFSGLFTASAVGSPITVRHAANANNCSSVLRGEFNCSDCNSGNCQKSFPSARYLAGSRIMPLISNAYFIGDSSLIPGTPALKRQAMISDGGAITTRTEELATGVENIQFSYGIDTDDDGIINEYRSANNMDIDGNSVINDSDWQAVLAVKVDMLLISQSDVFSKPQSITFNGTNYQGHFMRQIVSATIQIRNQS